MKLAMAFPIHTPLCILILISFASTSLAQNPSSGVVSSGAQTEAGVFAELFAGSATDVVSESGTGEGFAFAGGNGIAADISGDTTLLGLSATSIAGPANLNASTLLNGGTINVTGLAKAVFTEGLPRNTLAEASSSFSPSSNLVVANDEVLIAYGTLVVNSLSVPIAGGFNQFDDARNTTIANGPGFNVDIEIPVTPQSSVSVTDVLGGTNTIFAGSEGDRSFGVAAYWSAIVGGGFSMSVCTEDIANFINTTTSPIQSRGFVNAGVSGFIVVPAASLSAMTNVTGDQGVVPVSPVEELTTDIPELDENFGAIFSAPKGNADLIIAGTSVVAGTDSANSVVDEITLNFDQYLIGSEDAFLLTKDGESISLSIQASYSNGATQFKLQPQNSTGFPDGVYELTLDGDHIADFAGNSLDADENDMPGGLYTYPNEIAILFGDSNGDRTVGLTDFAAFRSAFGTSLGAPNYNSDFDADSNGVIGLTDFAAFRSNFGESL